LFETPHRGQLRFFGDGEAAARFDEAIERAKALGGVATDVDFEPFIEVASLLYGAWTAERILAPQALLTERPETLHPVTRAVMESGLAVPFRTTR
jgi:allophanate hydrolase